MRNYCSSNTIPYQLSLPPTSSLLVGTKSYEFLQTCYSANAESLSINLLWSRGLHVPSWCFPSLRTQGSLLLTHPQGISQGSQGLKGMHLYVFLLPDFLEVISWQLEPGGLLSLEKGTNCGPTAGELWLSRPAVAKKGALSSYHIVG